MPNDPSGFPFLKRASGGAEDVLDDVSTDFSALAGAVAAGAPGVRVCLIATGDGLALGAHPAAEEARALGVWGRISALGAVGRGFMTVDEEMWAVSTNGHYSALAVSDRTTRPGLLLERLDAAIAWAEERRSEDLDSLEAPIPGGSSKDRAAGAGRRFRMPLHRESKAADADLAAGDVPEPVVETEPDVPARGDAVGPPAAAPARAGEPVAAGAPTAIEPPGEVEAEPVPAGRGDVDVIALAREFAGLLSE